jgi:methylase of polypeptide subunit release factors
LEKLICHRCGVTKTQLFTHIDKPISEEDMTWIQQAYDMYTIEKKPLEYILGWVEFLRYRFVV